ncbi:plasmid partitioning protein RepB C-terminal domain-containing protein [Azospira oryzae]|uniref:plasmid partitioning protein RepB C-terminal domain-containing protein n=1 Tax=Azospira oryzae TaxID=146939 RepID=UPI00196689B9|nr:plasmid partitioning protein RepB C-terminal domain-containing protein [Azospira oryzae]
MIKLNLPREPHWITLAAGVRLQVRPATTALVMAARHAASKVAGTDTAAAGERTATLITELAKLEAVELMVASNTITVAHADALLKATPPEQRTDFKPTERDKQLAPIEQIVKLEKEMSQVQTQYKDAKENYGSDLLNLVVAKGYLTKLLGNDAVKSYITRHEPEILEHFELVVNTVSMEEAVQQQLEADGEFEEPPEAGELEQKGAE